MQIPIKEIKMRNRIRRQVGDLSALKQSMRRHGLLQPVLIDPDNYLIAGFRRLEAAQELGWETIEARMIDVADRKESLLIEAEENTTRRDFSPEELEKAERLLDRYGRSGLLWRLVNFLMDLFDRIFRR